MENQQTPGPAGAAGFWLDHPDHRTWLAKEAEMQFSFFAGSQKTTPGFHTLGPTGAPLPDETQELHTTTRLVHSFALGQLWGYRDADQLVDHGMDYLNSHHRDAVHGGYLWALKGDEVTDTRKLAYGHMFVLLAAASAKAAGHSGADALIADVSQVLDAHFWDEDVGLFVDEWNRDWTPFSTYRGMNANMHGVEALLTAYEATGVEKYLSQAGRILDFFTRKIAAQENWRLPEHYTDTWDIDRGYSGDPMFRPAGTTPGHSFELARLLIQHWDLLGRPNGDVPARARRLIEQALHDAWRNDGGFVYTLEFGGEIANGSRFWWPVAEAICAVAALIKLERNAVDEVWYRRLWLFANAHFIDHEHGGWFPEIDESGAIVSTIFQGKPDIYHSIQACLFPLVNGLSHHAEDLKRTEYLTKD